jgi:DNA polymerase III delta subunit
VSPAKKPASAPKKRGAKIGYYAFLDKPDEPLPPLVVIAGKEHLLAAEVLQTILQRAVPDESMRDLNVDMVDGSDSSSVGQIAAKARALPFLAERRVVVVRGTIDLKADDRRALASACSDLPDHAAIVIDHSGTPLRAQGRKPADEALEFAASTAGGIVVDCTLDAKSCDRLIGELAAAAGVQVSADARALMASTESAAEIRSVIERLALTAEGKRITLDGVKSVMQSFDDVKLWDFTAAVHAGDADLALQLLRDVLAKPDDVVGPLFALAADAIAVWELKHSSSREYAEASGQNAWRLGKLQDAARALSPENAGRAVTLTTRALDHLFNGRREGGALLDEVVVRLCDLRRRPVRG